MTDDFDETIIIKEIFPNVPTSQVHPALLGPPAGVIPSAQQPYSVSLHRPGGIGSRRLSEHPLLPQPWAGDTPSGQQPNSEVSQSATSGNNS